MEVERTRMSVCFFCLLGYWFTFIQPNEAKDKTIAIALYT